LTLPIEPRLLDTNWIDEEQQLQLIMVSRSLHSLHLHDPQYISFAQIPLGKMTAVEAKQTEQEASLLARLNHPNIVAFWESFVGGDNLYIVMEFANGTNEQLRVMFSAFAVRHSDCHDGQCS
jgi:serine/threonine protein kinase